MADCPVPAAPEKLLQIASTMSTAQASTLSEPERIGLYREYILQSTRYTVALTQALSMCNADKAALRAWRKAVASHDRP